MSLWRAYIGTRVLETSDNYALADGPLVSLPEQRSSPTRSGLDAEEEFWHIVMADPDKWWGARFAINGPVAVSEWIARVPGLFWKPGVSQFREFQRGYYELIGPWHAYPPRLKSARVMGGIGTLRLPPSEYGNRLVTLTLGLNASAGIPALISPEVWDKLCKEGPAEGRLIAFGAGARWQAMSLGWAAQFQATSDVPRGYLMIGDPDTVEVWDEVAPVLIHPFSVMEYREGAKELFDFVFATADTGENYRGRLEVFFADYAQAKERYGRYLLAGDVVHPIWEADFNTPAELRRTDPAAGAQLTLLEARVRKHMLGDDTIEHVLDALAKSCHSSADLERVSGDCGIEPAFWLKSGSPSELASQLVDQALDDGKLTQLIEVLAKLYPNVLTD
jgi:hypothetical protein